VQLSKYVAVSFGLTFWKPPLTDLEPFQLASSRLVAVQLVALLTSHSSSLEPPCAIVVGVAVSETVGRGAIVTVVLTGGLIAPPPPAHDIEYVVVAAGETAMLPLVAPPVEKPVPAQVVAFALDQLRLLVPPAPMVPGVADSWAVTLPATLMVTLAVGLTAPPAPTQISW
jgi:hypothetical protein